VSSVICGLTVTRVKVKVQGLSCLKKNNDNNNKRDKNNKSINKFIKKT